MARVKRRVAATCIFTVFPIGTAPAAAVDLSSPCPVAVAKFGGNNPSAIFGIGDRVIQEFDYLDRLYRQRGEPGIMGRVSDNGVLRLVALVVAECKANPDQRVGDATVRVYAGMREVQKGLGILR